MSSTVASDTYRERVLNVFVNFEQFKEDYKEFRNWLDRFEGKGEKSMAYLDCSVKSCTYNNEDGCCCKGDIQVEGRDATEAQSTCCGSFKDRGTNGAACNALKDVSKEIDVACEATHCRFNENEKCQADHIGISGAGACTCGETECASFECNCKYE